MLNLDKHSFNCAGSDPDAYYRLERRIAEAKVLLKHANLCLDGRTSASQEAEALINGALDALNQIVFQD